MMKKWIIIKNIKRLLLVLLVILISSMSSGDNKTVECRSQNNDLKSVESLAKSCEKITNKQLSEDIPKFCIDTAKHNMYKMISLNGDSIEESYNNFQSPEELEKLLNDNSKKFNFVDAWPGAIYPHLRMKKTAYENKIGYPSYNGSGTRLTQELLIDFLSDTKDGVERFKDRISYRKYKDFVPESPTDLLKKESDQTIDFEKISTVKKLICAEYTPFHSKKCAKALEIVIKEMTPRENIMILPTVAEVLSNPTYVDGAAKAALKVMKRIKENDLNGNLMKDIVESYKDSGLSEDHAKEHAWNLIAVWASRGPNIYGLTSRFLSEKNIQTLAALDVISSAIPYLDELALQNGKNPYSYPPQVKTKCSYGKSYHFWMSAFIARKAAIETGDPKAAKVAAYLSEIGYQMKSGTTGRDPNHAFMIDHLDEDNNKMRIDVAFGSAGAVYGANDYKRKSDKTLDVDNALKVMIKKSKDKPILDKKEAEEKWSGLGIKGYLRWKKIIAPDAALKSYE